MDFLIFDFSSEFFKCGIITFGVIVISCNSTIVEAFNGLKLGIFFNQDRVAIDLIFGSANGIHEVHGVVKIEEDNGKNCCKN